MLNIQVVNHSKIKEEQLKQICQIKKAFGNYTLESQLNWIDNNIKVNDIHFLIYNDNKLVAYANLIEEILLINNKKINILGIGNVCVDEKGKEKGKLLILKINEYLIEQHRIGLLFCKASLVEFYKKYDWKLIKPNFSDEMYWMIFNYDSKKIKDITYKGKIF